MTTTFTNASHDDQRCARCGSPAPRRNYVILPTAQGYANAYLCTVCYLCHVAVEALRASTATRIVKGEKRQTWRKVRLDRTQEWYFEREQWLK